MTDAENQSSTEISFSPPVFQQRYTKVLNVIRKYKPKKVVDFGCAECRFIRLLRNEDLVEYIIGVDIDRALLERHVESIRPLATEYLQPRLTPSTMQLFQGSVSKYDERISGVDAVIMIEVIEHLVPDVLAEFPDNIFRNLNPRIIVITTPNADFNVVFNTLRHGEFRHWDHKFEWTRSQFHDWCQNISSKYKYSVSYTGIGQGPAGTEVYGCCSQMAVFVKNDICSNRIEISEIGEKHSYSLIEQWKFPHVNDIKHRKYIMNSLLKEFFKGCANGYLWKNGHRNLNADIGQLKSKYTFNSVWQSSKKIPTGRKLVFASGQFDDAVCDNSFGCSPNGIAALNGQHSLFYPQVPFQRDKFGQTGFIKYLQKKYFMERENVVLTGQFEDDVLLAFNDSDANNTCKSSNFSYVVGLNLYLPLIVITNLMKVNHLDVTLEEITNAISENHEESIVSVSKDGFVVIDMLAVTYGQQGKFNSLALEESSEDGDLCDIDWGRNDESEPTWYSIDEFAQENWD
uniref:uncharacterized protein LOC120338766 isoform X1 n=2 Tax=Styela clava TaxID=7725 RepID=UPI00193AAA79|nr:uncharacterized protein LOC120338766 isoform X1 [Styela clava]XP_039262643.1 uncharacterized protein LOC120338766 isoform X1 [Styela clava]